MVGCAKQNGPQAKEIPRYLEIHDLPRPVAENFVRACPALGDDKGCLANLALMYHVSTGRKLPPMPVKVRNG
jgi:hypothetical protein